MNLSDFLRKQETVSKTIDPTIKASIDSKLGASTTFDLSKVAQLTDGSTEKEAVLALINEKVAALPGIINDLDSFESDTKEILEDELNIESDDFLSLEDVRAQIVQKIIELRLSLSKAPKIKQCIIGNTVVNIPEKNFKVIDAKATLKPAGIAELLVVKKKLLRFQEGEIAHIENVLESETKNYSHRSFVQESETISTEKFREQENLKDSQTSEQFSLQKETLKVLNQQKSTDKSLDASVKYGNGVVSASINAGYKSSNQSQQSQAEKSSSSFAKETTERALERVITQVSESRTRTKLTETEIITTHGFINTGESAENISGIYYWVDKYYQAQTYNYGKRMMYQLMIDSPSSNYLRSIANDPKMQIEKPIHPAKIEEINRDIDGDEVADFSGKLKTFDDITESNYKFWTALYGVKDVDTYPENKLVYKAVEFKEVLTKGDSASLMGYKAIGEIDIPEGYKQHKKVKIAIARQRSATNAPPITGLIGVQDNAFLHNNVYRDSYGILIDNDNSIEKIPYSLQYVATDEIPPIANIGVVCVPTQKTIDKWQLKIYNSIMEVYEKQKAEYDKQLSVLTTQIGEGENNPDDNRRIEKEEIRKACIESILSKTIGFSFFDADGKYVTPKTTLENLSHNYHSMVAFMEEAFEWDQMIYEFLPYYWTMDRITSEELKADDPLFENFLRASAAKAILPVRPGFERPVMHFLLTQKLWQGGNEKFSIAREDADLITEIDKMSLRNINSYEAVGEPWEMKVPTSLIVLSKEQTLSGEEETTEDETPTTTT